MYKIHIILYVLKKIVATSHYFQRFQILIFPNFSHIFLHWPELSSFLPYLPFPILTPLQINIRVVMFTNQVAFSELWFPHS